MKAPAGPSTRRELVGRVALAGLGLAVGLLLCEALLRVQGYRPERPRPRYRVTNAKTLKERAGALVLDCYRDDPRSYFDIDLRRSADQARYAGEGVQGLALAARDYPLCVEFRYNSAGYRDVEFGPRRPGLVRIAVVGDSFTEGQGVRAADTLARVLEHRLAERHSGQVEVLNYGRRGADLPALSHIFQEALAGDPDLIVYAMVLNDGVRSPEFERAWPKLNDWIMVRRPELALGPLDSRLAALVADQLETRRIDRLTRAWYRGMYDSENAEGWRLTRHHLHEMKERAAAKGAESLVLLWPLLVGLDGHYPFEELHARLARVCARERLAFHDALQALRGRNSRSLWAHPGDLHPNEEAQRLVVEDVLPTVERLLAKRWADVAQPH